MLPKLLLLVTCLYVVQAALEVDAPVGGVDVPDASPRRADRYCDDRECSQHCRSLGYVRGVCIGTRCQCRQQRAAMMPQWLNEETKSNNDEPAPIADEALDNKSGNSDEINEEVDFDRNESDDDQTHVKEANEKVDDYSIDNEQEGAGRASARTFCHQAECNRFCLARGYRLGTCFGVNICRCHVGRSAVNANFEDADNEIEANKEDKSNSVEHDDAENAYDVEDFNTHQVLEVDNSVAAGALASARACTNGFCNQFCRSKGYAWGHCISANICRCYRYRRALNENEEESANETESGRNADDVQDFNTQSALSEDQSEEAAALASARACTNGLCNQFCRSKGYAWGHCISANICRCYRYRRALNENDDGVSNDVQLDRQQESTKENSAVANRFVSSRACNEQICNKNCRALHYDKGICVISRCQCLGRPIWFRENSVEASHDKNDAMNAEINELKAEVALLQEEIASQAAAVGLKDCNPAWCDQTCRRIGFPGGACANGRCKCDILRRNLPTPIPAPERKLNDELKRKCIDYQCAEDCRRMRFRSGLCNGDSCICFN